MHFVPRGVAIEFLHPEGAVVRRRRAVFTTAMPVPEAAVDENRETVFGQHEVGANVFG